MSVAGKLVTTPRSDKLKVIRFDALSNPLSPIDVDNTDITNHLSERAAEEGRNNLPAPEETGLWGEEVDVEHIYQQTITGYYDYVDSNIQRSDDQINLGIAEAEKAVNAASLLPTQFEQKLSQEITANRADIDAAKEKFLTAKKQFEDFRAENRLTGRNVKEEPFAWTAVKVALLAFFVIIEGILNASFFSTSLESGLLGGFFQAAIASFVNISVAVFFGYLLFRQHNRVQMFPRILGWLSLFVWVVLAVVIAFGIAHYRDALEAGAALQSGPQVSLVAGYDDLSEASEESPAVVALRTFIASPFTLHDMMSWLLLALTLVLGTLAFIDGYCFGDPYPGYGAEAKAFNKRKEEWNAFIAAIQADFDRCKQECLDGITQQIDLAVNAVASLYKTANDKRNLLIAYENAKQSAAVAATTLLHRMRTMNRKNRTAPAPLSYSKEHDFKYSKDIATSTFEEDTARIRDVEAKVVSLRDGSTQLKETILRTYNRQCGVHKGSDHEAAL